MSHRTESWSRPANRIARRAHRQWRGALEQLEQKQLLTTFTVTDPSSDPLTSGSLAWAITAANNNPGVDDIAFNLGGGGAQMIALTQALPSITGPVNINGNTQPGYAGTPLIQIDGGTNLVSGHGLTLAAGSGGSTIQGLSLSGFIGTNAAAIATFSNGNALRGNWVGLDATGTLADPSNFSGILVTGSSNTIGGVAAGQANRVANSAIGVVIDTGTGNVISGNSIVASGRGISLLNNGNANQVAPVLDAVASATNLTQIDLNVSGLTAGTYNIQFFSSAPGALDPDGIPPDAYDARTYLGQASVTVNAATPAIVTIPLAVTTALTGNQYVTATATNMATNNTSAFSPVTFVTADAYLVTNNADDGRVGSLRSAMNLANASPDQNTIEFSINGAAPYKIALLNPLPAITNPVVIDGTTQPGFDPNTFAPVVQVDGGFIGTYDTTPPFYFTPTPNVTGFAINVGTTTTSPTVIKGLAIGNFTGSGVEIVNSSNVVLQGNYIGLDTSGVASNDNCSTGVLARDSSNIQIGGIADGTSNIISGNDSSGIVFVNVTGAAIQGNKIGVDRTGLVALPNGQDGINLTNSTGVLIGVITPTQGNPTPLPSPGTTPAEFLKFPKGSNIIAANGRDGVVIWGPATGSASPPPPFTNQVVNNIIGFVNETINAQGDVVASVDLGNKGNGVLIGNSAWNNLVQQNLIMNNGDTGVAILSGNQNALYANEYYQNGKLGIDLNYDGSTANDLDDSDTGANTNINYPNLTSALSDATSTTIVGNYQGAANTTLNIQLYTNPASLSLAAAQGRSYLGYLTVTTDANGVANFTFITTYPLGLNEKVTAIASDTSGNTSEISGFVSVKAAPTDLAISLAANPASVVLNNTTVVTATVTNQGKNNGTNVVVTIRIPVGFTITSTTPAGLTIQNNVVTSTYAFFPVGSTQTVAVNVTATQLGNFQANASVTLDEADVQPSNNQASTAIIVTASASSGTGTNGNTGGTTGGTSGGTTGGTTGGSTGGTTGGTTGGSTGGSTTTTPIYAHVTSVQRIVTRGRTQVLVTYSQPMDPTAASNASNYYFVMPGRDGKFGTKDDKVVGAQLAAFNAANNTVLVTPYQPHTIATRPMRIAILGSTTTPVKTALGAPLDGALLGKPSNFLASVPVGGKVLTMAALPKAPKLRG